MCGHIVTEDLDDSSEAQFRVLNPSNHHQLQQRDRLCSKSLLTLSHVLLLRRPTMTPMMFSAKLKWGSDDSRSHIHFKLTDAKGDLPA